MILIQVSIPVYVRVPAFNSVGIYPEVKLLNHIVILFLIFWRSTIQFSKARVPSYMPISNSQKDSDFFTSSHLLLSWFLFVWSLIVILMDVMRYLIVVLICISLVLSDEYLSMCFWLFVHLLWRSVCLFKSFAHYLFIFKWLLIILLNLFGGHWLIRL